MISWEAGDQLLWRNRRNQIRKGQVLDQEPVSTRHVCVLAKGQWWYSFRPRWWTAWLHSWGQNEGEISQRMLALQAAWPGSVQCTAGLLCPMDKEWWRCWRGRDWKGNRTGVTWIHSELWWMQKKPVALVRTCSESIVRWRDPFSVFVLLWLVRLFLRRHYLLQEGAVYTVGTISLCVSCQLWQRTVALCESLCHWDSSHWECQEKSALKVEST